MFFFFFIKKKVSIKGVGLHSGQPAQVTFSPAPENTGIFFVRKDLKGQPALSVKADLVQATTLATTLGGKDFSVSTVEHCLSALAAYRIDNLFIELEGAEIPICDGSAREFLRALEEAEVIEQGATRKYMYIDEPIYFGTEEKHACLLPHQGLRVTCTIEFPHPQIGLQKMDIEVDEYSFSKEIASARTFGFLKDVEKLKAQGLAKGGSLENAVVLDHERVLNEEGLRFPDEFVRHKVLDALGDIVTLGYPIMGHLVLYKTGHDLMNKFVKKVLSSPQSYRIVELASAARPLESWDPLRWTP
ncbi:MAG: UDP-3-O-acyl-N-acetylglucosamine deacetylase [Bdellovibrio sp.]|nr:MAG: UDP-3-O-acyl-N-acetylglucosamine deacetylase [Bdellovibrio sp.]